MSSDIETIKERLNIVDVIGGYIKLEKAGVNYKAKCPFHNEKTPSFFVSPGRQSFYCFGCGEKGDIFTFVEKYEGLGFREALEQLADRAGVKLERFKGKKESGNETKQEKEKLFDIMEEATKIFEKNLQENKDAIKYLKGRGVEEKTIKNWRLGFACDKWRGLHDKLLASGYDKKNLLDAGLIKEKEGKFYDTFRDRVIFPIADQYGRVVAFSGRAVDHSIGSKRSLKLSSRQGIPKYLNSPETMLYRKSEILHGFHIAKNHIRKLDYAVLVEGQMDLIMSHQAGVLNTVASSGTALTESHIKKIQRFSNRVIIAYDSDPAGVLAGERAGTMSLSIGMEAKIAISPEGEDPASVIEKNPEEWKRVLRESLHFTDYMLKRALDEKEGRKIAKKILEKVLPLLLLLRSEIEKTQLVQKISEKLGVNEEAVWSDFHKINDKNLERTEKFSTRKDEREALIFEAEKYGFQIDVKKEKADKDKKVELQKLKQKLKETASLLDNKNISKSQEEKIKSEFQKIQKRIIEIS